MWQIQYYRAAEIAAERTREAAQARLAREVAAHDPNSILSRVQRVGALLAARMDRGLGASVAQGGRPPAPRPLRRDA
jgi:hypothetical protein